MFFQFLSQELLLLLFFEKLSKMVCWLFRSTEQFDQFPKFKKKKIAEDPIILKNTSLFVKKLHIYNIHVYV